MMLSTQHSTHSTQQSSHERKATFLEMSSDTFFESVDFFGGQEVPQFAPPELSMPEVPVAEQILLEDSVLRLKRALAALVEVVPAFDQRSVRLPSLVWHLAHLACQCDRAVNLRGTDDLIERAQSRDSVLGDLLRRYMLSVSMAVEPTNVLGDRSEDHARQRLKEALQALRDVHVTNGPDAVWLVLKRCQENSSNLSDGSDQFYHNGHPNATLLKTVMEPPMSPVTSDDELLSDSQAELDDSEDDLFDGDEYSSVFTPSPPATPDQHGKGMKRGREEVNPYELNEALAQLQAGMGAGVHPADMKADESRGKKRRKTSSPKKKTEKKQLGNHGTKANGSSEYRLPPPPRVANTTAAPSGGDWRSLVNHISIDLQEGTSFDEVHPSGLFFLGRIDKSKCSGKRKPAIHAAVTVKAPKGVNFNAQQLEQAGDFSLLAHTTEHKQGGRLREKVEKSVRNSKGEVVPLTPKQRVLTGSDCIAALDWGKDHEIGLVHVTQTGHLNMKRGPAGEDSAGGYLCLPLGAHFDVGHFRKPSADKRNAILKQDALNCPIDNSAPSDVVEFSYVHALSCNESVLETRVAPWMVECFELRVAVDGADGKMYLGRAVFQAYSLKVARLKAKQFIAN